jgi:hypothetical protein
MSNDTTETIATYSAGGATYEIDHLGILHDSQWGEFAVYRAGEHVASFAIRIRVQAGAGADQVSPKAAVGGRVGFLPR